MMNKFGGGNQDNNQTDVNNTVKTDPIPIDLDQAALINHRHTEVTSAVEDNGGASVVHSVGHQLQSGRIACNLSIEDVARQLRLSAKQIEALEKEDFEKLPTGTFLRGFIRNYANLVKLDPKPMLRVLPSQAPAVTAHTTLSPVRPQRATSFSSNLGWGRQSYRNGRSQKGLFKVIGAILLLLVIYGIYHNINWEKIPFVGSAFEKDASTSEESRVNSGQSTIELQLPISPATSGAQSFSNQPVQAADTEASQKLKHFSSVASLSAAIPHSEPADSHFGLLHFNFASDSWVEVKNQAGRIVYKQENVGGTEQIISGKRPLSLVISNAAYVDLTYNERMIDLVPYTDENDGFARLTLE